MEKLDETKSFHPLQGKGEFSKFDLCVPKAAQRVLNRKRAESVPGRRRRLTPATIFKKVDVSAKPARPARSGRETP